MMTSSSCFLGSKFVKSMQCGYSLMWNWIPHPTSSPAWNLSKNIERYVENTNEKSSFILWQICQFNHHGWLILLKFYCFLNSNSQNLLLAHFLIRPILDPKFPLMRDPTLLRRFLRVRLLERQFVSITYIHIPRNDNQFADSYANYVLDWHLFHS